MATRILLRRDTSTNWTTANPILALGEPGYDETASRWKMGDGATAWTSLAYATDQVGAAEAAQAAAEAYADSKVGSVGAQVPSWAGSRLGWFNPASGLYMPPGASLTKTRAAVGQAMAGTTFNRVVTIGDSTAGGTGATRSTTSWPAQTASLLTTLGVPKGGTGVVPAASTPQDSRWVLSNFNLQANNVSGPTAPDGFAFAVAAANGATATFNGDVAGTIVDIYYYGTSGTWTYAIDGGAATPVSAAGQSQIKKVSVTGLTNGTHTLVITTTSASSVYIVGAEVRAAAGMSVTNLGISNVTTNWWTGTTYTDLNQFAVFLAPQLTVIDLGINDRNSAVAVSTYKTNLTSVATTMKAVGDVVLLVPNRVNVAGSAQTGISEDPYISAAYDVADAQAVPLIDMPARIGAYAQANTAGLMSDAYHPTAPGYAIFARAVAQLIAT